MPLISRELIFGLRELLTKEDLDGARTERGYVASVWGKWVVLHGHYCYMLKTATVSPTLRKFACADRELLRFAMERMKLNVEDCKKCSRPPWDVEPPVTCAGYVDPPTPDCEGEAQTERVVLLPESERGPELTHKELEERLNVTAMTIHLWRKEGLPAIERKIGDRNRIFFRLSGVLKWLDENRPAQALKFRKRLKATGAPAEPRYEEGYGVLGKLTAPGVWVQLAEEELAALRQPAPAKV